MKSKVKGRIESFQVLRGIAILLVFISHCDNILVVDGTNRLMYLGGMGVSIFITLSGFLTAYKYSETSILSSCDIYISKWKKFGWLHIITLLAAIPFSFSIFNKSLFQWMATLILNGSLLQTWIPKASVYFSFNAVSWYLSITLVFALITPFATKLWYMLDEKKTIIVSILLCVFEFYICYLLYDKPYIHWAIYVFPLTRSFDFIMGGVLQNCKIHTKQRAQDNGMVTIVI